MNRSVSVQVHTSLNKHPHEYSRNDTCDCFAVYVCEHTLHTTVSGNIHHRFIISCEKYLGEGGERFVMLLRENYVNIDQI